MNIIDDVTDKQEYEHIYITIRGGNVTITPVIISKVINSSIYVDDP